MLYMSRHGPQFSNAFDSIQPLRHSMPRFVGFAGNGERGGNKEKEPFTQNEHHANTTSIFFHLAFGFSNPWLAQSMIVSRFLFTLDKECAASHPQGNTVRSRFVIMNARHYKPTFYLRSRMTGVTPMRAFLANQRSRRPISTASRRKVCSLNTRLFLLRLARRPAARS